MDVLISLGGLISYLYSVAVLLHSVLTLNTGPVEVCVNLIISLIVNHLIG